MKIEKLKALNRHATTDPRIRSQDMIFRLEDKINEILDALDLDAPDDYYTCECGCEWFKYIGKTYVTRPGSDLVICRDCGKEQTIPKQRLDAKLRKYKRYGVWSDEATD